MGENLYWENTYKNLYSNIVYIFVYILKTAVINVFQQKHIEESLKVLAIH